MANTHLLKTLVEPYVRRWLSQKYNVEFEGHEKEMRLVTGGVHRFDAVSKDGSIIAGIKTSALRSDTTKRPIGVGVIKSTFTELYYLSIVNAKRKLMVLTDKGFYDLFCKESKGKVSTGIEIIHCQLSQEILDKICVVHDTCRKEIGKR